MVSRAEFPSLTVAADPRCRGARTGQVQWLEAPGGFVTPDAVREALD